MTKHIQEQTSMMKELQKYCINCNKYVYISILFSDNIERCCNCENEIEPIIVPRYSICRECGEKFPYNGREYYCSDECREKKYYRKQFENKDKYPPYQFRILLRDNFTCQYCGKTVPDGISLHVDHIFPINKGGDCDNFNLITSCNVCNISKQDMVLDKNIIFSFWDLAIKNDNNCDYKQLKYEWIKRKKVSHV